MPRSGRHAQELRRHNIPSRVGHAYIPIQYLPITELQTTYAEHRRLKVFKHKGCKCITCGVEGVHLIKGLDPTGGSHVDLYTKDFRLMTVDHNIPKSKGGSNDLSNLDPMCERCNTKKSNKFNNNVEYLAFLSSQHK